MFHFESNRVKVIYVIYVSYIYWRGDNETPATLLRFCRRFIGMKASDFIVYICATASFGFKLIIEE